MKVSKRKCLVFVAVTVAIIMFAIVPSTQASIITAQLTGDFRAENPDNLIADVTIDFVGSTASWVVDINSPAHPDVRLGAFYFNLDVAPEIVSFSNFMPNNLGKQWGPVSGTNAVGSGGADFDFGIAQIGGGSPQPNAVNNAINLTFDMMLTSGIFTPEMFFNAGFSTGGGIPDPGAQLGAHLQSLVGIPGGTDSGFASGNYVPIPPAIFLLGSGLLGIVGFRRKFKE